MKTFPEGHSRHPVVSRGFHPQPDAGEIENATDLFIDPGFGLRVINEIEQLVMFDTVVCDIERSAAGCSSFSNLG